jgi:phage tail-like protein
MPLFADLGSAQSGAVLHINETATGGPIQARLQIGAASVGAAGRAASTLAISGQGLTILVEPGAVGQAAPFITFNFAYFSMDGGPAKSVRVQVARSDGAPTPSGGAYFFDSGWVAINVPSGVSGGYTVNAVEAGIPTDTGSGSVDPTLHLVATISVSEITNPAVPSQWGSASTPVFDLQWGVPSAGWVSPPTNLVSTPNASMTWSYSDTRGFSQGTYEAILTSVDGTQTFYDSGPVTSAVEAYIVPYTLVAGSSYLLTLVLTNANGVPAPPLSAIFVAGQAAPAGTPTGGFLERFLDMLAFQLNVNRSLIEQLRYSTDPIRCPGNLLPLLAQELGVAYEAEMGMTQTRKLLKTVVHQYKMKGTAEGVEGITTAVTGWPATVGIGPNLALGPAHLPLPPPSPLFDSPVVAFDDPNVFFSAIDLGQSYLTGTEASPNKPANYKGLGWPTTWPVTTAESVPSYSWWSTGDGDHYVPVMSWDSLQGSTPQMWGIPLPAHLYSQVSVGVWVWVAGASPQPQMSLTVKFWGQEGTLLSSTTGLVVNPALGAWSPIAVQGLTVPAGTQWVSYTLNSLVSFDFLSGQGVLVVAAAQVEAAATLASYTPPRQVQIDLTADRTNLMANPSFENGTATNWKAVTNCTISPVSGVAFQPLQVPNPGTWSLSVTSVAAGPMSVKSDPMPIEDALLYTASAYVQAQATPQQVTVSLVGTKSDGTTVVDTFVSISAVEEVVGQWQRPFAQVDPAHPWSDVAEAYVQINWLNTSAPSEVHYLDAVLLETGWALRPYFDADIMAGTMKASDYFWFQTSPKLGPSFYFKNFATKLERLKAVLKGMNNDPTLSQQTPLTITGFLPLGVSFVLLTGAETSTPIEPGVLFDDASTAFDSTLVTMDQ